jgi:microcystin-dependent protein
LCDGQSTSSYPELAAVVGANVPNLKGRVPVGRDTAQTEFDALGETGGAKTHTLTTGEMPAHTHTAGSGQNAFSFQRGTGSLVSIHSHFEAATTSTGSGEAHNNLQPYVVINYIIKT